MALIDVITFPCEGMINLKLNAGFRFKIIDLNSFAWGFDSVDISDNRESNGIVIGA